MVAFFSRKIDAPGSAGSTMDDVKVDKGNERL
jgi:hypothetical protein